MKRLRLVAVALFICVLLISCNASSTNKESNETTVGNNVTLTTSNGKNLTMVVPTPFSTESAATESDSMITLYSSKSSVDTLSLHIFPSSSKYGEEDVLAELDAYTEEYHSLATENDGKIIEETQPTSLSEGEYTIHYTDIEYSLSDTISYCAKFYAVKDNILIVGTMRVGEETKNEIELSTFLIELFDSFSWK